MNGKEARQGLSTTSTDDLQLTVAKLAARIGRLEKRLARPQRDNGDLIELRARGVRQVDAAVKTYRSGGSGYRFELPASLRTA
jgi:hypothetical protein